MSLYAIHHLREFRIVKQKFNEFFVVFKIYSLKKMYTRILKNNGLNKQSMK